MTNRLSKENVQHNLDAGHQNLPWTVSEPSGFLAGIDFNAILDNPQAKEIIQSLPVQPLYYGLKKERVGRVSIGIAITFTGSSSKDR